MPVKKSCKGLPKGVCKSCPALCCRYIMTEIDRPIYKSDFEDIRWYVAHENISVIYDDKKWFLYVDTRCKHLSAGNLCEIYDNRPSLCRKYTTKDCDFQGEEEFDIHLQTVADVDKYIQWRWGNAKRKQSSKKKAHHATRNLPTVYLKTVQLRKTPKKK